MSKDEGVTRPARSGEPLNSTLERNIRALAERHRQEKEQATVEERVAHAITRFAGSMPFVYLHLALYGGWIALNLRLIPGWEPSDPTFVILAMIASVEAIFLSTFVLITQNRMVADADRRAHLDLQIDLLTEHEITRLAVLVTAIARHLGLEEAQHPELREVQRDIAPEVVLDRLEDGSP